MAESYPDKQIPVEATDAEIFQFEPPAEADWREQHPAMAALIDHCESSEAFADASEQVKAAQRPHLAVAFVRGAVQHNGNRLYFDQLTINRNIDRLHGNYGPFYPTDHYRRERLDAAREQYIGITDTFSNIPEVEVARHLYSEAYEIGDPDMAHAMANVLTAYGMALSVIVHRIQSREK